MPEKLLQAKDISPRRDRAEVLNGAPVAEVIKREAAEEIARLRDEHGVRPCLSVVRVGDDPASAVYVRNKVRACEAIGLRSEHHALAETTATAQLLDLIQSLNKRDDVDGILVQLPLPRGVDEARVLEAVDAEKDVDGFHPLNVGRLALGQPALAPCTPAGIVELLARSGIEMGGANACIVGRSNIVGRPLAQLLLQRDATVTICHSRTQNLATVTREADILIAAIGRAGFIKAEHIKPGATVIDVGINKVADEKTARVLFGADELDKRLDTIAKRGYTLVGDVHPAEADMVAGRRTPVPGGVGLLTVAMLMKNTIKAAMRRRKLQFNE
ncbi:MAG: bifunctional 5,10-methylenetetrahydrofolate dehydrogenase/5,10-methenyltetrahydrofolate cyclohydrolase [Pyrinomonadaceae bacterium]